MASSLALPLSDGFFRRLSKESLKEIADQIAEEKANKEAGDKSLLDFGEEELKPLSFLEAERKLPFVYGDVPKELISEPLEDLDPFYRNQMTFIAVNRKKRIYRFNATNSLYLFSPFNPVRRIAIKILIHIAFTMVIVGTILTNCVFMAMDKDYVPVEYTMNTIYMMEVVIKVLARGFFMGQFTFLRDPWNWLDLLVVIFTIVTYVNPKQKMSSLKTFRVLRVLKTISVFPGLKTIVKALIQSVKKLFDVIILTIFCLSIFALIGQQLFMGNLKNKCVLWPNGNRTWDNETLAYLKDTNNYYKSDNQPILCGNSSGAGECPEGYLCLKIGENPNFGFTNYDHFGWAFLSLFRLMTQDSWEYLYQQTLRSSGKVYMIFFVMVIFLGSFYLINLILAVVAKSYEDQNRAMQNKDKAKEAEFEEMLQQLRLQQEEQEALAAGLSRRKSRFRPCTPSEWSRSSSGSTKGRRSTRGGTAQTAAAAAAAASTADDKVESPPAPVAPPSRKVYMLHPDYTEDEVVDPLFPPTPIQMGHCNVFNYPDGSGSPGSKRGSKKTSLTEEEKKSMQDMAFHIWLERNRLGSFHSQCGSGDSVGMPPRGAPGRPCVAFEDGDVLSPDHGIPLRMRSNSIQVPSEIFDDPVNRKRAVSTISAMTEAHESKQKCPPCWHAFANAALIWEWCPVWIRIKRLAKLVASDPFMDLAITLCIVLNTVFMSLEHDSMSEDFKKVLRNGNVFFTGTFTAEMVLKIIAMDPYYYFQEKWNQFDSVVVTVSLVEMWLPDFDNLSVLRSFRLLRVIKLAKSWGTMYSLLKIIGNSVGALANLTFILVVIIFIFAVVGMQLFKNSYAKENWSMLPDDMLPLRWHMCDFLHSFMIVFRILCGEWIENMWICMQLDGKPRCIIIFMAVLIIGNLVVLNLFLALLLSSFSADKFAASEDEPDASNMHLAIDRIRRAAAFTRATLTAFFCKLAKTTREDAGGPDGVANGCRAGAGATPVRRVGKPCTVAVARRSCMRPAHSSGGGNCRVRCSAEHVTLAMPETEHEMIEIQEWKYDYEEPDFADCDRNHDKVEKEPSEQQQQQQQEKEKDRLDDCFPQWCVARSPCCASGEASEVGMFWSTLRKACFIIVEHNWFETFIIFMILLSSGVLAFEDVYIDKRKTIKIVLEYADKVFTYVFILEMLLKWLAYGLQKYFTNMWCWLDFLIVGVSVTSLVATLLKYDQLSAIKALRTVRALRPLRALSRFEGMRVVVNALIGAFPSIVNVLLVCLIFWLIFSIMGVDLFKGKFYKCVNKTDMKICNSSVVRNKNECDVNASQDWVNMPVNFDNVATGYLALLQVATFKGWIDIMSAAVDATKKDEQPKFEENKYSYGFFVFFITFGAFFILNLFIGVIIDNFNQQKKKIGGEDIFLTEEQRKFHSAMKKLRSKKPQKPVPRPHNKLQNLAYDLVGTQAFDVTIMALICLNMLVMMIETDSQSEDMENALHYINIIFIAMFSAECLLKLFALRHYYFKFAWNIFDIVVIVMSFVGMGLAETMKNFFFEPTLIRVVRLARIGRVLRLVRGAQGIRTLLLALLMSLPALFNIGLLLFLVMYIFSIFGMSNFGYLQHKAGINDMFNFETFGGAMLCLFQITTSAGWDGLLAPTFPLNCDRTFKHPGTSVESNCGNTSFGVAFYVSYIIISFLIVVNMYIAVILENFAIATQESTEPLSEDDFEAFYEVWGKFDPTVTQFIAYKDLSVFLDSLDDPLRVPKPNHLAIAALDLPIVAGDRIHCLEVLFSLTKRVLGEGEGMDAMRLQMEERFMDSGSGNGTLTPITSTLRRWQEELAAIKIQRAFRNRLTNRKPSPTLQRGSSLARARGSDGMMVPAAAGAAAVAPIINAPQDYVGNTGNEKVKIIVTLPSFSSGDNIVCADVNCADNGGKLS
ncbi:sodium channel protein type 2 subunit alpha isoform X1 [Petromyzon marinus]|uniref:sodium channel protein type 2 subunit alpha isoform X1 n=1 Tax=Petromyzon marinus TaxID=7757 RepID=UPI003F6FEB07